MSTARFVDGTVTYSHRPRRHGHRCRQPLRGHRFPVHRRRPDLHGQPDCRVRRRELLPDHQPVATLRRSSPRRHHLSAAQRCGRITAGGGKDLPRQHRRAAAQLSSPFGAQTLFFGRATDIAAFDGTHYYAIANSQFTDTNHRQDRTRSAATPRCADGNSYEIFSNLGQGGYFEVPDGPTYYVNVAVADFGTATGDIYSVFPVSGGRFTMPLVYTVTVAGTRRHRRCLDLRGATAIATLDRRGRQPDRRLLSPIRSPASSIPASDKGCRSVFIDSNNTVYPLPLRAAAASPRWFRCRPA